MKHRMACVSQKRLRKEQEEKEDKRKYNAQAYLYATIKVARDEDLREQIGKDIYFDLVDHDKVRHFRIQNWTPFNLFKEEVAKELGIPVKFPRFWIWVKRQNHTYRPSRPLTPKEEAQTVGALREVFKTHNAALKLFLEVEHGRDLHPVHPPDLNKEDILLFFKLYDPLKEELRHLFELQAHPLLFFSDLKVFCLQFYHLISVSRYVGRLFLKSTSKPIEILTKLNEMAGFARNQDIILFEEIKFEPSVMCERLEKKASFQYSQIESGGIICFQKWPLHEREEKFRFPDVPSYFEYVKNCQIVHFRSLDRYKEDQFSLELAKNHTYDDVVERVAQHLGLDDPSKIRLTPHNCYSQQPKPNPIKYGSLHLLDMLVDCNFLALKQISDVLYFEVLDIPLPVLQCLKTLEVTFHHATKDAAIILNIRLPKPSTVGDVLNEIKSKVKLSHPDVELRLLKVFYHKIYKIIPKHEKIENINDQYWILRAEEIPTEEKNLGPNDRLIHVYHFTKDNTRNQQVKNFGEPFVLVIHEGETVEEVKARIQKKLQVADEEFSKWKFALFSLGRPEYPEDSDIVSTRFQRRDVYSGWEHCLGLEHSETTPKRAYSSSQPSVPPAAPSRSLLAIKAMLAQHMLPRDLAPSFTPARLREIREVFTAMSHETLSVISRTRRPFLIGLANELASMQLPPSLAKDYGSWSKVLKEVLKMCDDNLPIVETPYHPKEAEARKELRKVYAAVDVCASGATAYAERERLIKARMEPAQAEADRLRAELARAEGILAGCKADLRELAADRANHANGERELSEAATKTILALQAVKSADELHSVSYREARNALDRAADQLHRFSDCFHHDFFGVSPSSPSPVTPSAGSN